MLCSEGREASKAGAALAEEAEVETLYYVQGGAAAWKACSEPPLEFTASKARRMARPPDPDKAAFPMYRLDGSFCFAAIPWRAERQSSCTLLIDTAGQPPKRVVLCCQRPCSLAQPCGCWLF